MAFVVEDGTGIEGANAYITVEYLREYASSRGISLPSGDSSLQALIVIASSDWFDGQHDFSCHIKLNPDQGLAYPNRSIGFPASLQVAIAKAAILQNQNALLVNTALISQSGSIESESKSVGSLSKSVSYEKGSQFLSQRILPKDLTNLVDGLVCAGSSGHGARLVRCY